MKALKVIDGEQTYFVFAQVSLAHEKVLEKLQYPRIKEEYGRAFPTNTPHLDHYFCNFERFAQEMLLQFAREQDAPWERALEAFLQIVRGRASTGGSPGLLHCVFGVWILSRGISILSPTMPVHSALVNCFSNTSTSRWCR